MSIQAPGPSRHDVAGLILKLGNNWTIPDTSARCSVYGVSECACNVSEVVLCPRWYCIRDGVSETVSYPTCVSHALLINHPLAHM